MLVHRCGIVLALAALACLFCGCSVRSADKATEKKDEKTAAQEKEQSKNDNGKEESAEEAKDPYKLPEGGVKELLAFIKEIQAMPAEFVEYQRKGRPAMQAAAERIQQIATDEDKKLDGYDDAIALLLLLRAANVSNATPDEVKKLSEDIKAVLTASETPPSQATSAAMQLGTALEYSPRPELKETAVDYYRNMGAALSKSKDPQAAKTGVKMEGAARRLSLPGNPLELSGTQMDGSKFDWAKYRGKVVLVDFWATWCGPCIGELPNVKKNYELYHDRGFEVVGVSLDRDRAKLEEFLEKEQNPWLTLHDGDWSDNATATYYGIMGIPTVILVDKEGKVVSTHARGPELGKQLEALLGPAKEADSEKPDTKNSDDDASN